ncbi:spinster family MFS transporter [Stakelama pacifica]|uniref:Sugar phosphate permease n=1 Tax=Stakelama pacifica TaxID=517720 RepID=A0A4R6FUI1_9SPHN|nr:MFS transporter [Stakelama pacifica]TDN85432.1 sugar phosphate permease [Stakelama pacifica]GGO92661.1 MFS transporter [Stakelama pacifica]
MTDKPKVAHRNRWLVLAMLLVVYTFNFLDRQILGILAVPIQENLGLSDSEFGIIGGTAFAILYSVLGVPLALLADKVGKSRVIAGSLVVWSGFTALCGTAWGFWSLFLYRLGVGVGEAGGVAPSYALIADYFPVKERARAIAIYSLGIPIGLGSGVLLGAYIAANVNWQAAFITVGIAGILVAPVFLWIVRDKPMPKPEGVREPMLAVLGILSRKPAFWLLATGAGCSSMAGYGLALWVPKIIAVQFGWTQPGELVKVGQFMASLLLIGGTAGMFLGGVVSDKLAASDRAWYARVPAIAWVLTAPLFMAGLLTTSPVLAWCFLIFANSFNTLWLGPLVTASQHLAPARMRAGTSGAFLMINNLLGLGIGPWLMGAISDQLKGGYGVDSLRYAAIICVGLYLVAAVLVLLAIRSLKRDWVEGEA